MSISSGDDDDDLPTWITSYKSPIKQHAGSSVIRISDSESDFLNDRALDRSISSSSERDNAAQAVPVEKQGTAVIAAQQFGAIVTTARSKPKGSQPGDVLSEQNASKGLSSPFGRAQISAKQVPISSHKANLSLGDAAAAQTTPHKSAPHPVVATLAGEIPVVLSDKLSTNKAIAELESLDGGQTDMHGDSGAVGRVLVARDDNMEHHMQFDLKGIMYDARHAQLAGTLMVINIGQEEACVQSVFDTFLQLDRTSTFVDDDDTRDFFLNEDDDDFQNDTAYAAKAAAGSDGKISQVRKKSDARSRPKSRAPGGVVKKASAKRRIKK